MDQNSIEERHVDLEVIEKLVNVAIAIAENSQDYSEPSIEGSIQAARTIYPCNDATAEAAKRRILSRYGHTLDMGSMIQADHKAWYLQRTKEVEMLCTRRNRSYLIKDKKMSPAVVSKLYDITDEIMDGLGDPRVEAFQRRGLVMGDVQSGKTSVYTILSCKAVDVGYRLIILLTGTIEILRQQTQSRMDEGLVGKDSAAFIKQKTIPIGVGKYESKPNFGVFTSTEGDFNKTVASRMNIPVNNMQNPYLMVLKKNKDVLKNLYDWLKTNTVEGETVTPLLLIDDEADNASINTSADDVTVINRHIRNILSLFKKSTYVGFTATPYANIFINSDEKDDLYPRDFIYCLSSPSNYVGPSNLYSEGGRYRYMLKTISFPDEVIGLPEIPYKHNSGYLVPKLPDSLVEAVNCFLVSCAIRDLRGQIKSHMSMLVNVSRFTNVQESVKDLLSQLMFEIKDAVAAHSHLSPNEALRDPYISKIKEAWVNNYSEIGFEWEAIQHSLESAINPISVRSVNQRNGPKNLNYADSTGGLRVIAVGGNSLSRGLTLEGLCVSYFYRKSQSYDTLMQMGRWFGYRDEYDDLCRVWMTQESMDWYLDISEATEELKYEFRKMRDLKKTPIDFGFRVKNDINGLTITARNKMRYAGDDVIIKSVSGRLLWTSYIYVDEDNASKNQKAVSGLIPKLNSEKAPKLNEFTKNWVWNDIDSEVVVKFLEEYQTPYDNMLFDNDAIIRMIRKDGSLLRWDVALQHGDSADSIFKEFGVETHRVSRNNYTPKNDNKVVRFNSSALISPDNLKEGLLIDGIVENAVSKEDYDKVIDDLKQEYFKCMSPEKKKCDTYDQMKNYPAITYLQTKDRRPLLLLYPIKLGIKPTDDEALKANMTSIVTNLEEKKLCPIGVAIGFPAGSDSGKGNMHISYKTSVVYSKMKGNEDLDEPEE